MSIMGLIQKATNAFAKAKNGLVRAAPVIHNVRRWSDVIGNVAGVTPLPGAGVVRALVKGIGKVDDVVQKIAA